MSIWTRTMTMAAILGVVGMVLTAPPAAAQQQGTERWFHLYVQQSFPKQTNTNLQIQEINDTFGVSFDDWDDMTNLSVGAKLLWRVARRWNLGVEVDGSFGQIDGEATVDSGVAGPADLKFVQKYSIFTNVMACAHYLPYPDAERVMPFVLGGVGYGYEKDETQLTFHNSFFYERLEVENDGWFPVATVGAGLDIALSRGGDWFVEIGGAYYWGRLDHLVPAQGSLAPAPKVRADTDSTGPNWWIGVARRF